MLLPSYTSTVSFQYHFSFNPIAATTMLKILTKIATEEAAHVSLCQQVVV